MRWTVFFKLESYCKVVIEAENRDGAIVKAQALPVDDLKKAMRVEKIYRCGVIRGGRIAKPKPQSSRESNPHLTPVPIRTQKRKAQRSGGDQSSDPRPDRRGGKRDRKKSPISLDRLKQRATGTLEGEEKKEVDDSQ